ncbi:MAG: alpha/beta fold hydrolase [Hydrogenophaga sp.]
MSPVQPFVRDSGAGPAVVCLHANASSSSQWRGLMDLLAPTHRVLAVDSYGSGKSPEWPSDRLISLDDEADLIEPVLASAQAPVVLVGHSYGAAVALIAALRQPARVRALVLYEPTLFSLVDAQAPTPNAADGIRAAVRQAAAALDRGDTGAAAEAFIDYWMEPGSWAATPAARQPAMAASVVNVRRWKHALMTEPTPLAAFARLHVPVLLMVGGRTTLSAQAVADLLFTAMPQVQLQRFDALGHMGPVTHPGPVNAAIAEFVRGL